MTASWLFTACVVFCTLALVANTLAWRDRLNVHVADGLCVAAVFCLTLGLLVGVS